jgi:hypothetical protein
MDKPVFAIWRPSSTSTLAVETVFAGCLAFCMLFLKKECFRIVIANDVLDI